MAHRKALREYYLVLGLEPGASLREVKQAYRAGVKRWHPDQFNCDAHLEQLAEEKLKEINEAYTALSASDGQRAGYARYGRPMAGQRGPKTSGFQAGSAGPTSGWQYDGSAGIGGFRYQSAYYRRRQAKPRAAGENPYSAGYAARPRLTKATIRRWIIVVVVFAILSYANTFSGSLLRLVTKSGQAGRVHPTQVMSPAAPPRFDARGSGVPILTIVERPAGKFEFPRESSSQFSVLSSQKKQTTTTGQQR